MTYEEYWHGDPFSAKMYYEKWKYKVRHQHEEAWLYGIYMSYAINSTIGNAFRGKNEQAFTYPTQPLINAETQAEEEKAKIKENERLRARLYMENMVRAGKNWGKKTT